MQLDDTGFTGGIPGSLPSYQEMSSPFTVVYQFRVAARSIEALSRAVAVRARELRSIPEFLGGSIKHMQGLSTMVKNYPAQVKGVLASVYDQAAAGPEGVAHYVLLWRFASGCGACEEEAWFERAVVPLMGGGPGAKAVGPKYYQGIFQTVAAATRTRSIVSPDDVIQYMKTPADLDFPEAVTVLNHVLVHDERVAQFDRRVSKLLETAQAIFRPDGEGRTEGLPGAVDNDFYCRPFSTEILRAEAGESGLRPYLMYGIWPSVCDHENSHLDLRFRQASAPLASDIVQGPEEPFYRTDLIMPDK